MIRLEKLYVSFEEFSLRDISFEVKPGEYFVVLGPSGSGKTVLLESIAGFMKIRSGRVVIDGRDATFLTPEQRRLGYMFQESMLFPHLSVEGNIVYGLKRQGRAGEEIRRVCRDVSELLGVSDLLERSPATLSGGEAQRVSLARTLAVDPAVLLLDEPLSSIDPAKREALQEELRKIHGKLKKTMVHVTHSFEEAISLADRIAIMNDGRIVQIGTAEEIFRRPESEFVARFSMARNIFKVAVEDAGGGLAAGRVDGTKILTTTRRRGGLYMSIRPEDILISKNRVVSSALNSLEGVISRIEDKGSIVFLTVDVPPGLVSMITVRSFEEMGLTEGDRVFATFKASAVWVF